MSVGIWLESILDGVRDIARSLQRMAGQGETMAKHKTEIPETIGTGLRWPESLPAAEIEERAHGVERRVRIEAPRAEEALRLARSAMDNPTQETS